MDDRLTAIRRTTPLLVALCIAAVGVAAAMALASALNWQLIAGALVAFALVHRVTVRTVRPDGAAFEHHPSELVIAFAVVVGVHPFVAAVGIALQCFFVDALGTPERRASFRADWQRRTKLLASSAVNLVAGIATWTVVNVAGGAVPDGDPLSLLLLGVVAGATYGVVNGLVLVSLVGWAVTGRWLPEVALFGPHLGPALPQAALGSALAVLMVAVHPVAALVALAAAWPLLALLRRHDQLTERNAHVEHLIAIAADADGSDVSDVGDEVGGAVAGLLHYASGQVRDDAPVAPTELGAPLPDGSWLVVSDPINLELPDPEDQPRLVGLGVIAGMLVETARERARHSDELQTDALTGLANRAGLRRAVDRLSPDEPIAVLFLDLNGFKPVNDTYGHDAGDRALAEIARRLRGQLRSIDIAARVGGDEFLLALPALTDPLVAEDVADRVARAVASPLEVPGGRHVQVETAIGIAMGQAAEFGELVVEADAAMFADKRDRSRGR